MARKKLEVRVKILGLHPYGPIKVPQYTDPETVALLLEQEIRKRTPIDTGEARAGWEIDLFKNGNVRLTNNVDYVQYLQFGHSRQAPRGFAMQALTATRRRMRLKSPYRKRRKGRTSRRAA